MQLSRHLLPLPIHKMFEKPWGSLESLCNNNKRTLTGLKDHSKSKQLGQLKPPTVESQHYSLPLSLCLPPSPLMKRCRAQWSVANANDQSISRKATQCEQRGERRTKAGNNNSTVYSLRWQYLAQISDNLYAHRMRARGDIVLKNEFMRLFMTSLRLCFCFCFSFSLSFCSASSASSYCVFVFVSSSICNSCFVFNWSYRPHSPLFPLFPSENWKLFATVQIVFSTCCARLARVV